jgi:hypothetical protein
MCAFRVVCEIIFDVVGGDAEGFGRGEKRPEQDGASDHESRTQEWKRHARRITRLPRESTLRTTSLPGYERGAHREQRDSGRFGDDVLEVRGKERRAWTSQQVVGEGEAGKLAAAWPSWMPGEACDTAAGRLDALSATRPLVAKIISPALRFTAYGFVGTG